MTRSERRWLAIGILTGILVTAVASVLLIRYQPPISSQDRTVESHPPESTSSVPEPPVGGGQVAVQLSPADQAKIGIQTSEVRRESVREDILVIGRVEEPETAIATISTRFGGRVERLFVNFTGQPVKEGDPIATISITGQAAGKDDPVSSIYSRDQIAAAEEYQFALENRKRASRPDAIAQADALVEASRVRLERFGLAPDQKDRALSAPEQPIRITVNSTASGVVRSRKVAVGQFVNPGDALIELSDLGTVWVKAQVYDSDIARIRPGVAGTITSEALPGLTLKATVAFIDPNSDPVTRTTPVRLQVNNPGTRLKPGMVVQAALHMSLGMILTVPRDAVIDSGSEKVVYIARENGVFEQKRVEVGTPVKDRYPVKSGLSGGDKVVSRGVFLVDSQTRLSGTLTGMFGGSKSFTDTTSTPAESTYKLTFRIEPDPPMGTKENTIHVALTDPTGKPVSDAQIRLTFVMPAMPAMNMPEMRNSADLKWTGSEYTGPIQIMMAGGWNVAIEARRGDALLATAQTRINAR